MRIWDDDSALPGGVPESSRVAVSNLAKVIKPCAVMVELLDAVLWQHTSGRGSTIREETGWPFVAIQTWLERASKTAAARSCEAK